MQVITPEVAQKIIDTLSTGAESLKHGSAEFLNELINYVIFIQAASAAKAILGVVILLVALKIIKTVALLDDSKEHQIRMGIWKIIMTAVISLSTVALSYSSFINLGKALFAPKVFLLELAVDKIKEVKQPVNK